jgi:hypothetical protein
MKRFVYCVSLLLAGLLSCSKKPVPAAVPPVAYDLLLVNVNAVDVAAAKVVAGQYVGLNSPTPEK